MDNTEMKKKLDAVYRALSTMPISGDYVEVMASVRIQLRKIYAELEKECTKDVAEHGE